ncbi:alpha/beta fold hydrolase [Granulosicoccaceae sp. 1_MG-2023]|nr:alpha/beta fold hydrolase [Granulosicoccaceae sp. 1_MG-2023]
MALELYTHRTGDGPPLVVLHGLFGSWENLGTQIRSLAKDYTVYGMDLRNHGRSPHDDFMDYPTMAADVLHTLDTLGLERTHLLGHSMGGKTAMTVALTAPERIDKLVVVDVAPKAYEPGHNEILEAMSTLDVAALKSRSEADAHVKKWVETHAIRAFLLKNLVREDQGFSWKLNLPAIIKNYPAIIDFPPLEGPFTGPALFLKGAHSDYIQAHDRERINTLFPNATAKLIDGTGHWPHSEKPAVFYKLVSDFLADTQADPA